MKPMTLAGTVLIIPENRDSINKEALGKIGMVGVDAKHQGVPNRGTVYAIGKDITDVKVGDRVYFDESSPQGFKIEGISLIKVKIDQIMAVER